jgi:hypothetical protein
MNNIKLPTTVIGKRIELKGLSVFPLYLKSGLKVVVRSGLEMIDKGVVHVKEVSDAGSVPTLYVTNDCLHNVLFVEGDQLVGAKQNRMCNSSVLIAPNTFAEIPVSCVEQGRWHKKSEAFSSSSNTATPDMRKILKQSKRDARKAFMLLQQQADPSTETAGVVQEQTAVHHASQGAVWGKVENMQSFHASPSPTSSMEDVFEAKRGLIDRALQVFKYPQDARGWLIAINGEIQTIELFGKKKLCEKAWKRAMRGCVLEAEGTELQQQYDNKGKTLKFVRVQDKQVLQAVDRLSELTWERVVAVSAGEEYRGDEGTFIASQLHLDEKLVHLSAVV